MTATPDVRLRHRAYRRVGFTLVEVLVVVFIISILIAITVGLIPKVKRSVYGAQTSAQLAALATAIQAYYSDFRAYPGPIPNAALGGVFYSSPVSAGVTSLGSTSSTATTYAATGFPAAQQKQITGAENLVLGLLGGLEADTQNGSASAPVIAYNPNAIFPDGTTPNPKGAMTLNFNALKRWSPYLQVKTGDLSPNTTTGFVGSDGGKAKDSMIPEFMDKFSNPMPILFLRANVGATGVVTAGGVDPTLSTPSTTSLVYQYDIAQVEGYTTSTININPGDSTRNHHGLQGVAPSTSSTTKDTIYSTTSPYGDWGSGGANALPYLADPSSAKTTNALGTARQKDGFILISAGPDGIYGTSDDVIYPGGSVSP